MPSHTERIGEGRPIAVLSAIAANLVITAAKFAAASLAALR